MSESSESDDGPSKRIRHRRGNGKNSRKIVMRIEFDDSDDSSSGSETSSEEPIRPSGSGRRSTRGGKRLISSGEEVGSSGSEIVRTVLTRGRHKRKAVIVDEEPAVDDPHTSVAGQNIPSGSVAQQTAGCEDGFASDSSNDDLEKCPICLLSLRSQEIGKPSVCDHLFCAICIEEWARNVRTCPIDRQAFDSIVVQRSINNREFVREIKVEETAPKNDFEEEIVEIEEEEDVAELENCQICHLPDREDVMLLCDGCNQGYHMDCLANPLTEIPDGFWYCDNCFASEEEDIQDDLNVLYEDLREMGIPETRLRVREVRQPRIPRTRQSERIRASIMARTRRSNTRISSEIDFSQPSSSTRAAAASRPTTTRRRTTRHRRSYRRTARQRQRRTYVVEYDVDNFDQKFQIKTTKKVIRKRKSGKRARRRTRGKTTIRSSSIRQNNANQDYLAQRATQESGAQLLRPQFSLFGDVNGLEYFSDESDSSIVGGESETGRGAGGGASIETSIRIHSFASGRSHSRRKAIIRDLDQPRQADVLSSILDMQDRFHNATRQDHISQVRIGPDGSLNLSVSAESESVKRKGDPKLTNKVSPNDINQAPMYPRGGGGNNNSNYTNSGGGGYNNRFNNQSNYRNSTGGGASGGSGGQFRGSNNSGTGSGSNAGGFLFNAFRRDNNSFQSDNNFQQNRPNNTENSNQSRDRFRQNQNQQQRRNQNNQNRFSGGSGIGGGNDNANRNTSESPTGSFSDSNNANRLLPPTSSLFSIGPISLFDTPTKPLTSESSRSFLSAPSSFLGASSNTSSFKSGNNSTSFSKISSPFGTSSSLSNFNSNSSTSSFNVGNNTSPFSSNNNPPPFNPSNNPPPFNPSNSAPPFNPSNSAPPFNPSNSAPSFISSNSAPPFNPNNSAPPFNPSNSAPPFNTSVPQFTANNNPPPFNASLAPPFNASTAPPFNAEMVSPFNTNRMPPFISSTAPPFIAAGGPPFNPNSALSLSTSNNPPPANATTNIMPASLHQPPPPILPVYGPINITGPDPPPTEELDRQRDAEETTRPIIGPSVAPLAPPPWNQNLFRLTSDYADSNDDDDDDNDDSNCPNFSVYSAESFQVARSSESGFNNANEATGEAQASGVACANARQEDEFEEKEEDLVQLGDDDDIPGAIENSNTNVVDSGVTENKKNVPESEIYEPEFPTTEPADEDDAAESDSDEEGDKRDDQNDDNDESVDEDKNMEEDVQKVADMYEEEKKVHIDNDKKGAEKGTKYDEELESAVDINMEADSEKSSGEEEEGADINVKTDDDNNECIEKELECTDAVGGDTVENEEKKTPDEAENKAIQDRQKICLRNRSKMPPKKRGVLELYDDSDWEEWNIDKAELIPMPPEPSMEENEDITKGSPAKDESWISEEATQKAEDQSSACEPEAFASQRVDTPTVENESFTPDKDYHSPDEAGTPEIDQSKLRQIADKDQSDNTSDEGEPERSYTPCLDEKTEHEVMNSELRRSESIEKEKMDERGGDMSTSVVDGMEMELISEEDEELLNAEHAKIHSSANKADEKSRKDGSSGKRSKKEQFKKISKSTKERNYRDKEKGVRGRRRRSSRCRSDSRPRGKENRNRPRQGNKRVRRKEIERYNVRNVVGQPRSYKDRYGRDTSRPGRSRTRSRSRSFRRQRTISRSRSPSLRNNRRSFSMSPTPVSAGRASPRRMSPRRISSPIRRSPPRRRRNFTPRKSRSKSPRRSRSLRKSSLPRKRSRPRSISIDRPISRRNQRLKRRNSARNCSRSCSRSHSRYVSHSRSPVLRSPGRSRSKSPMRPKKIRKRSKERKKKRTKKRMISMSPSPRPMKRSARSMDRIASRKKKKRPRTKSPVMEEEMWSQSPAPVTEAAQSQNNESSWTPPLMGTSNDNLTVILKNKDAAMNGNKKKRERKEKNKKKRENTSRKEKRRQRSEMRESPVAPSKEVFASGNNILVSVSFNKDNNGAGSQQTTVVTLPPTREEIMSKRRSAERQGRKQRKPKEKIQRRRKKLDTKPVAIIDLDRSPFQVIAQSPRDIIVLTDESDREPDDEENNKQTGRAASMEIGPNEREVADMQINEMEKSIEVQRPSSMEEEPFEVQQLGPKTPPEPPSTIKFSMAKSKQIKNRNPLHEEPEEIQEEAESDHGDDQSPMHASNKIGPNTPPESGPCSPDAYDPFDPTKSPSLSPAHSPAPPQDNEPEDVPDQINHPQEQNPVETRPVAIPQDKPINPVELVMALINTKTAMSQKDIMNLNETGAYTIPPMKPDGTDAMNMTTGDENNANSTKSITVLSSVLISTGKQSNRTNQILNTSPPIAKSQSQNLTKMSMQQTPSSIARQNGGSGVLNQEIGTGVDIESPYSPGSADYEDLFEPPPPNADNSITLAQLAHNRKANKAEMFDNLFGSTSPVERVQNFPRRKHANRLTKRTPVKVAKTKLEDDQVKIFEELPSSAVELQVKDKFLRKLNRQERVVEEVKLVLKPHYNKKRISKEDYKEILRRAVPKICHSRSGEINPAKIKNLIEAYVKKFRQRNKLNIIGTGQVSSAVKCAAYLKKL